MLTYFETNEAVGTTLGACYSYFMPRSRAETIVREYLLPSLGWCRYGVEDTDGVVLISCCACRDTNGLVYSRFGYTSKKVIVRMAHFMRSASNIHHETSKHHSSEKAARDGAIKSSTRDARGDGYGSGVEEGGVRQTGAESKNSIVWNC